ncbi:MAG: ComF family protein [Bacteroidales bacterium]|nr:ComF family protein [Bacteroidales bacterium]
MSLIDIFFPQTCVFCGRVLVRGERIMCLNCHKFYRYPNNALTEYKHKITEMPFENIDIFLDYSYCKKALHSFKYGGNLFFGKQLAFLWAEHLKGVEWIEDIDFIMPISLHRKKLYKRGFNQSEVLGKVLSKKLQIPILTNIVKRKVNNPPQTKAENRWENVRDIFVLRRNPGLENKHVLIIDDVVTTSATTNYFVKTLRKIPNLKLSFAYLSSNC